MKLLYVDDDDMIREVAEMALSLDAGLEVRSAAGGEAALAMLDESGWTPDLLLIDVMMPQMDGPTLLTAIRSRPSHARTPAVFFTARAMADEHKPLLDAGAHAIVTKPFDPMTLAAEIRRIHADWAAAQSAT